MVISMNYFIVSKESQIIENIIVWDGKSEYDPGEGFIVVPANGQAIGEEYQE